ncbi:hypothetical protein Gotur_025601 [Gossypium turneri]
MKKGANILIFNMIRHEEQSCYTNQTQKVTWESSGSIARQQANMDGRSRDSPPLTHTAAQDQATHQTILTFIRLALEPPHWLLCSPSETPEKPEIPRQLRR